MGDGTNRARGAIATSHHLATEAGAEALRSGGNAIDAALAAAAVLCVVYPNNVALGSDLVALVRSSDGSVRFLNATGRASRQETLDALRARHGSVMPTRGVDTITIPGGIRGWEALHRAGAKRDWSDHFDRAVEYARDGVPLASSVARGLLEERSDLEQDPGCREVFYPGGTPLAEGELLVQSALAQSLGELSKHGASAFYEGALGKRWVSGLRRLGSTVLLEDAATYAVEWADPLESEIDGYRVLTSPPNTQGFALLRALRHITSEKLRDPLGIDAGRLALEFRRNNAIRDALLADPRTGGLDGEALLAIKETPSVAPSDPRMTGDTVGISAASSDGWAVSLIQSIYHGFGSGILEPESGIIFHNRGMSFSLDPMSPNVFAPGKRPRHTLMPVLVLRGNEVAWVPATMGGQAQPQIHAHLLMRVFAGMDPARAVHAPRWAVMRKERHHTDRAVTVEAGVAPEAIDALKASGMDVYEVAYPDERLGHANLISVTNGVITASSDPRSDGSAVVVD